MNHTINIPNHTIVKQIGEGGMGVVFLATDNILQRRVAVKALKPDASFREEAMQRFQTEAVTLAKLSHPNITMLHNLIRVDGRLCMIMEYAEGETLESILRRQGTFTVEKTLHIAIQTLEGLQHAHEKGVIHRDLKPSNLMLSAEGNVKIMDFGIARIAGHSRLTKVGQATGTPQYMSPEQVRGEEGSYASDIYSLGVVMYELLTGVAPFTGDSEFGIMQAHTNRKPISPAALNPAIPAALNNAILKALAKAPSQRFANAAGFRQCLQQIASASPPKPPQVKLPAIIDRQYLAGAVFLAVSLLAACLVIFSYNKPEAKEGQAEPAPETGYAVSPQLEIAEGVELFPNAGKPDIPAPPKDGVPNPFRPPARKKTPPTVASSPEKQPPETEVKAEAPPETSSEAPPEALPEKPVQTDDAFTLPDKPVVIPRGTRIDLLLDNSYDYDSAPDNIRISLSVPEAVVHSGVTIVRAGAKGYALLHKNTRRGELELEMLEVESITGQRLKSLNTTYKSIRFVQGNRFRMNLEYNRMEKQIR
jgi:serine/threonine-protein kinase